MDRTSKGILAIVGCACLWSIGGLFIKLIPWNPLVIAGARSLIAGLFILGARIFRNHLNLAGMFPSGPTRKSFPTARFFPETNRLAFWGGSLSLAATMLIFVAANKLTTAANVILLQYSAPVYAALLGWALAKEKPFPEHWAALVAVIFGLGLFFKDGLGSMNLLGDGLAILSGLTFGAYSVFMRMQKDGRPEDSILVAHLITALVGLPWAFINPPAITLLAIGAIMVLGIFQMGVAFMLFAYGIRRVSAVQSMLSSVIEPILNPVWVLIFTGERPGIPAIAGGTVILVSVSVSSVISVRRRLREEQGSQ